MRSTRNTQVTLGAAPGVIRTSREVVASSPGKAKGRARGNVAHPCDAPRRATRATEDVKRQPLHTLVFGRPISAPDIDRLRSSTRFTPWGLGTTCGRCNIKKLNRFEDLLVSTLC